MKPIRQRHRSHLYGTSTPTSDTDYKGSRFNKPAVNDREGTCVCCGRDNREYPNSPCDTDCPMYWEELGLRNPEYPAS